MILTDDRVDSFEVSFEELRILLELLADVKVLVTRLLTNNTLQLC